MYKEFFGLKKNPFEISPDPYFLFPTVRHSEALASIYHGVLRHKGFVVVTGEVGTGKTLLVRCLLELLRKGEVAFANVFNPGLSPLEFLRYIAMDLGLTVADGSKAALLLNLNAFLIGRYRAGLTTVLIVDEAQHLAAEVLEEIRLLTNLETAQQKLLQILLVGQPELEVTLDSPQLRQLKQRVALRCRLEALSADETRGYVLKRLERAGADPRPGHIFSEAALTAIHCHSKGLPRLINTISENSLITAYAQRSLAIGPAIVDEVAADLRLNAVPVTPHSAVSVDSEQQAVARSLLALMESLERAVRNTDGFAAQRILGKKNIQ